MALTEGTKDHLLAARDSYGSGTGREYDELFYEVHERVSVAGDVQFFLLHFPSEDRWQPGRP